MSCMKYVVYKHTDFSFRCFQLYKEKRDCLVFLLTSLTPVYKYFCFRYTRLA